ncbi:AAA family ATPase [Lacticaseibacillus kribbianus]|uniref:AAA family ATPase n=1 Tax=Lacticaseibacillus kribbianus TaxID=2926292 RepID=UPI001CD5E771|nr:MoxR family ATPase [Lacticaseibacillus kribbianus]
MTPEEAKTLIDAAVAHIDSVIVGKKQVIRMTIAALLAGGHVLFEDIPGVGKTTLAKALARTFMGEFHRIQFTPDLLPSDILGVTVFDQKLGSFRFQKGPVFTAFLLADEINRATPRVQSALLEAMAERRVTIDDRTHDLPADFFVLATQNPVDYEGTYPLPEAQLDRFLMRLSVGYPDATAERELLALGAAAPRLEVLEPLVTLAQLEALKGLAATTAVAPSLLDYVMALVLATRAHPELATGVSPRGALALVAAAKAYAVVAGRDFVTPDDLQQMAPVVLTHRLLVRPGATATAAEVLAECLAATPVPVRES